MTAAADGKLPLERAVELITKPPPISWPRPTQGHPHPRRRRRCYPLRPNGHSETDTITWQTRSAACARVWHGFPVTGKVTTTILRGAVIYDNGEVTGHPGYGEILRGTPAQASPVLVG